MLNIGTEKDDIIKIVKVLAIDKNYLEQKVQKVLNEIDFSNLRLDNLKFSNYYRNDGIDITFEVDDYDLFVDRNGLIIRQHFFEDANFTVEEIASFALNSEMVKFEKS